MPALHLLRLSTAALGAAAILGTVPAPTWGQNAAAQEAPAATTIATAPDRFVTFGDVRLRYREVGRGEAVVMLHGLARSLDEWVGLGDSLALSHRVIVLDQRGFGKSSRFGDTRRFGVEMADDVVRLLDHLRVRRAHLVGHSMGARIAAVVAMHHPDRVESVTLIAGPFSEDTASFTRDDFGLVRDIQSGVGFRRFLTFMFPGMSDSLAKVWNDETMAANDPATLVAVYRSMDSLVVLPSRAKTVQAPALVAVGTGDPLRPESQWIASWWPRAQLLEVQGADHLTILYSPQVLAALRMHVQ
jgi:pimeloyl-ACP methyl ester carboxylesterase